MSKQVQVNLAFNADTAKAKQQINDLVNSLNKIAIKDSQIFDDRQLREAATAAKDLTKHLESAVNVNTGKLDLNKFSQSLSQSKQNLQDLYNSLSKAGPTGQQAFLKLASSIASSESRVLNLNAKVKDLGVTLKNTVKWQLSSSLIHGFMGALQHAIGYARDLNSSLNDIRIVTGFSVNEMARFAEQANKAAKSLSATTTEYTKASLIYYQQGLSEEQVKERTDITMKMANVSRQSAEIVSEQMTAVWNNFADGTKSLEYYADVMTALGAATASSVDEIAGGLEKFAAIGDTIGLSYEYAASALATITSNTRQSEEVVGTALKTIFARIQGLNLGETLDDGTTLNKYSQALQKVGISIFDQNGELKKMDTILDEMGNTWQALSKDQQTALAQTVAGTRQYTQLIALMDNWDKGDSDSFKSNLYTIADSEGALQEQQDIYSESWEAAADRVKAATEDIYDSLINDEAIIVLLNGLEKVLNLTGALIDGFGGLKGILLMVAGIFTRQMANEVPQALSKLKNNFEILTGTAQKKKEETIQSSIDIVQSRLDKGKFKTAGDTLRAKSTIEESRALLELEKNRSHLSEAQQQNIQKAIEERKASKDLQAALLDEIDVVKKKFAESKKQISTNQKEDKTTTIKSRIDDLQYLKGEKERALEIRQKKSSDITSQDEVFIKAYEKREQLRHLVDDSTDLMGGFNLNLNTTTVTQGIDILTEKLKNLYLQQEQYIQVTEEFQGQLNSFDYSIDFIQSTEDIKLQQQEIENLNNSMVNYAQRLKNIEGLGISAWDTDELTIKLSKCREVMETFGATSEEIAQEMNNIFKEWSSNTGTEVFQDLIGDSEKAEIQIGELDDTIQSVVNALQLLSPDKFKELAQEAEKTGQSLASLILEQQKANNMPTPSINTQPTMEFSTALTKVAGLGMDIMALFSSLGSAISVCFDEGATAGEKFIAVLSSIPAAAMSFAQITGALKDMPQALETVKNGFGKLKDFSVTGSGLAKVFGNMGTAMKGTGFASTAMGKSIVGAFTGATTSVLSFWASLGLIALAIAAVVAVIALLVKGFKKWKASTPEGKLETAKNTTQSMAEAAKDADNAYQDLLSTINGYDSAINALEDMEAGTQEFTNALIKANEEAWKLIDAYGLIQGIDWDYGENGEIIIKQESKDRITEEQNEKREDAIVAASASKIDEKQKAYDVAKDNVYGSLVYSNAIGYLTEDQQKKVYDVFGFSTGESKHLQERIKNATPEEEVEIVNELGAKYFGDQWDKDNLMQREFIITALSQMEGIGKAYDAYKDLTTTEANERQKMISTSMSDEEEYQKSEYKGAIVNSLEDKYDEEKAKQDEKYAGMSDKDVQNAFDQYLSDQGYIQEDGKVYKVREDGSRGDEVVALSNLDAEGQRNVLAAKDTVAILEAQGIEIAEKVNNITKDLGEEEKAITKAAIDGDVSNLTEDQIAKISGMSEEEIKKTYPAIEELANELGLSIDEVIAKLKSGAEDWEPPEFNTEEWKKDYSDKMKIINDLETGDSISAEDYALLGEEYQQYFQVQADGTAILIGKAEELKAKAQEIEIEPIKKDIADKQGKIEAVGMSTDAAKGMLAAADAGAGYAVPKMENYVSKVNELYGRSFENNREGWEQAIAFMEQQNQLLTEQQGTLAATATSVDELNKLRQDGLITEQQYAEATKATVIKEAKAEGFDVDEIAEYAEWLQKTQKETVETEEEAYKLALAHKKLQRGVDKLAKNWDKLNKVMTSDNPEEIAKVLPEVNDALKDILNMSDKTFNQLSPDFAIKNWKLIQDVMNGVEGSYEKLVVAAGQDIALKINPELDGTEAYTQMTDFMNTLSSMATGTELKIEPNVDNANALDGLVELLEAAGMFGEDIAAVLQGIGWEPKIEYEPLEIEAGATQASFGYQQVAVLQPDGSYKKETLDLAGAQKLSQEGKAFVPKIVSATKTGGSSKSYTPPSANKGGGGGGGKSKPPEKKSSTDKSRYHTIQNQLEDLKSEYEDISEAAEKAFGKDKLDAIDEQIKKNEELIASQEKLLGTYGDVSLEGLDLDNFSNFENLRQNLKFDKAKMEAYFKDLMGTGITFEYDEKGNISNFRQIEDYMHAQYNKNTTALGEEDWEIFEKKYQKLEEYIEQYEETYDELRDAEQEYQDLLNKRLELQMTKLQYKVELELAVPEDEIAVLEYQLGRIEDDAYKSTKTVQLLTTQAEAIYDQIQINKQGLNDIIKLSKDYNNGALTEEQADLIKEYRDNLLDLNEQFDDIRATIEEKVMETFDSFNEKLQTSVDVFDHYNSVLESYKNIVDIVGEDRLGISDQFMSDLNQASINNAIEQLKATDTAMKVIQESQAQAEIALAEAKARGDEASQRMWEETLSSLNEEAQSAQEEMLSAWENALNAIAETFEATVERVIKTFNESVYALGGLEGLQEDFSRQQENADIMLDDYQKIYELSKLSRDINKTIDDTDIIGGKQKLKKLLGEINKLQEDGVEMSQYDLEYLQKTYDLRLAELELEEAQRAKNTVRLSRDNEGNWSYIYTQNTDAVDAAQQKYEDALYAMQDLSSNYIDEMSEQLISTSQEMAEALAAIRIQDYANINDYYAEVERVQSQYQEELAMQEEELQKAIDNNKVLYDTDWTNYHNATGYKISDTELFATTFRDTLLGALMGSEEDSANFTDIMGVAVNDLTNNLMAGAEIYYTNLKNAMNAAGTSTGDFAEDTAANIDAVVEKSKEGAAAVDQMAIEMQTAMENIMDSVTNWQEAYGMAMENIIQSNLEVIESFNQMLAALSIDADSITVKYDIADAAGGQAQQFDTGGYTGEWGKNGKLAVLHEKELILKPEDTSNFLTAVQITRAMLETIDLNAKQASFGLGNLVPSTIRDDNNQTLEQQVHIVAEFPNVNDHNEIEQAFNNLINTASQYANRK